MIVGARDAGSRGGGGVIGRVRRAAPWAVIVVLSVFAALGRVDAASKETERLQIQIAGLQNQLITLQRAVEDAAREVKRLNEVLAEQNATLRKGLQEQRLQDEATQATLKDLAERVGELAERQSSMRGSGAGEAASAPAATAPASAAPAATLPAPRELYSQAYADYARGNYDVAIQGFTEYIKSFPDTEYTDNAQYWIGDALYGKQKYNDAVEAFKALIRDYPASDKLPDARVKMGMALEKLGRRSQALLEYRFVVDRYPNTPAARSAREKLGAQ
jgi:tol-pal system protein YbgF